MTTKRKKETLYKTEYSLRGDNNEPHEEAKFKTAYREFDEDENLILDITYLEDGSIDRKYEYEYDDGKLVDEKLFYDDALSEHNSYTYDKGKLTRSFIHYQDGSKDTVLYEYDPQGHLIKKTLMDEDEEVEEVQEWDYDDDNLISMKKYEENLNKPVWEEKSEYDEEKRLIEHVIWDYPEEKTYKQVLEYDEEGRESMIKTYVNEQLKEKTMFERDENGRPHVVIEEKPGERTRIIQQFDDKGRVITQKVYDKEDYELYDISRKFDENGIMLESVVMEDENRMGAYSMYKITTEVEYSE